MSRRLRLLLAAIAVAALLWLLFAAAERALALAQRFLALPTWLQWTPRRRAGRVRRGRACRAVVAAASTASSDGRCRPRIATAWNSASTVCTSKVPTPMHCAASWASWTAAARSGRVYVALFGEISTGKSSLLRALAPHASSASDVRGGTTRQVTHHDGTLPDGRALVLADVPGSREAGGEAHEAMARDEALRAHAVIYLCAGDLSRSQAQEVRWLAELRQAVDAGAEQGRPVARRRTAAATGTACVEQARGSAAAVVAISAGGSERFQRQLADGSDRTGASDQRTPVDPAAARRPGPTHTPGCRRAGTPARKRRTGRPAPTHRRAGGADPRRSRRAHRAQVRPPRRGRRHGRGRARQRPADSGRAGRLADPRTGAAVRRARQRRADRRLRAAGQAHRAHRQLDRAGDRRQCAEGVSWPGHARRRRAACVRLCADLRRHGPRAGRLAGRAQGAGPGRCRLAPEGPARRRRPRATGRAWRRSPWRPCASAANRTRRRGTEPPLPSTVPPPKVASAGQSVRRRRAGTVTDNRPDSRHVAIPLTLRRLAAALALAWSAHGCGRGRQLPLRHRAQPGAFQHHPRRLLAPVRTAAHRPRLVEVRSGRLGRVLHRAGHRPGRPGHGRRGVEQGGTQALAAGCRRRALRAFRQHLGGAHGRPPRRAARHAHPARRQQAAGHRVHLQPAGQDHLRPAHGGRLLRHHRAGPPRLRHHRLRQLHRRPRGGVAGASRRSATTRHSVGHPATHKEPP